MGDRESDARKCCEVSSRLAFVNAEDHIPISIELSVALMVTQSSHGGHATIHQGRNPLDPHSRCLILSESWYYSRMTYVVVLSTFVCVSECLPGTPKYNTVVLHDPDSVRVRLDTEPALHGCSDSAPIPGEGCGVRLVREAAVPVERCRCALQVKSEIWQWKFIWKGAG